MNIKRSKKNRELLNGYNSFIKKIKCMMMAACVGISSFVFIACSEAEKTAETMETVVFQGMEEEVIIECEVPCQQPSVIINTNGYLEDDEKIVLVAGSILPKTFEVVSEDTNEVVFIGDIIQSSYNSTLDIYYGYGDFSKVMVAGNYYITSGNLGFSYTFEIDDNLYKEIFDGTFATMYEKIKTKDVTKEEICDSVVILLLTYEIYGDTYEDGSYFAKNDIPETLDLIGLMVDQLVLEQNSEDGSVGTITDKYAGILAWFSYLYKEYNTTRATEYLKLADLAWMYSSKEQAQGISDVIDMNQMFAAAHLYRASGKSTYHTEFKTRIKNVETDIIVNYPYAFYAGFAYISTNKSTDIDWCAEFMSQLMEKVEKTVDMEREYKYVIREEEDIVQVYEDFQLLIVANYINESKEYVDAIKNRYHYVSGCNMLGKQLEISGEMLQYSYWYMILDQVK